MERALAHTDASPPYWVPLVISGQAAHAAPELEILYCRPSVPLCVSDGGDLGLLCFVSDDARHDDPLHSRPVHMLRVLVSDPQSQTSGFVVGRAAD
jgi:hypothetical protein